MVRPLRPLLLALCAACVSEPEPLPTAAAVAAFDRNRQPPLYQLLYDSPAAPGATAREQRVRILVWLRHLDLSADQLDALDALRRSTAERAARLAQAQAEVEARYADEEARIYEALWADLSRGVAVNAPEMGDQTEALRELRAGGSRERELIALRLEGVRGILDAEQPFLRSLSPRQEAMFADSLFFLRHRLDPVGSPGDFRALVGNTYEPGQFDVLTRGGSEAARERLNIGALWSDDPGVEGHALHGARREVLLLLALMEPGLDEAIAAARALKAQAPAGSEGLAPPQAPPPPDGSRAAPGTGPDAPEGGAP